MQIFHVRLTSGLVNFCLLFRQHLSNIYSFHFFLSVLSKPWMQDDVMIFKLGVLFAESRSLTRHQ